jgi:hypothetical protein
VRRRRDYGVSGTLRYSTVPYDAGRLPAPAAAAGGHPYVPYIEAVPGTTYRSQAHPPFRIVLGLPEDHLADLPAAG